MGKENMKNKQADFLKERSGTFNCKKNEWS